MSSQSLSSVEFASKVLAEAAEEERQALAELERVTCRVKSARRARSEAASALIKAAGGGVMSVEVPGPGGGYEADGDCG